MQETSCVTTKQLQCKRVSLMQTAAAQRCGVHTTTSKTHAGPMQCCGQANLSQTAPRHVVRRYPCLSVKLAACFNDRIAAAQKYTPKTRSHTTHLQKDRLLLSCRYPATASAGCSLALPRHSAGHSISMQCLPAPSLHVTTLHCKLQQNNGPRG